MDCASGIKEVNEKIEEVRQTATAIVNDKSFSKEDKQLAMETLYRQTLQWKQDGNMFGLPNLIKLKYDDMAIAHVAVERFKLGGAVQ